jgi:Xaa-Pro dipeptidase
VAPVFPLAEYQRRMEKAQAEIRARGLSALLVYAQESMYYLTGFDTAGYVFYQVLIVPAEGEPTLLTRIPDVSIARYTSTIEDVRVWINREGDNPARDTLDILRECGLDRGPLGIETHTYGLIASRYRMVAETLGESSLVEASDLVADLRLIKSPAEIDMVREAGRLADVGLEEVYRTAAPGVEESRILQAAQGEMLGQGGDYPALQFIIGSGPRALMTRNVTGSRALSEQDQLTVEFAGVYRRYHACLMRTLIVGRPSDTHLRMHAALTKGLRQMTAIIRPGLPLGEIDHAYRQACDEAGFERQRFKQVGYNLGATYPPNWMEPPLLYTGNPTPAQPGMVLFMHPILMDIDTSITMTTGYTVVVTEDGNEVLSKHPLDLVVK